MSKPKRKISEIMSYKAVHWVMFLLVLVNLFVVYRFERDRAPAVVRQEITTISNHVYVVTNVVYGLSDSYPAEVPDLSNHPTNSLGGFRVNDPEFEIPLSYHFFQSGKRYYIQIAGFTFGVGDMTSYGRITSIFPERVLLDNGYALKNDKFEERFGFGSDSLNLRRELRQLDWLGSNSSVVVRKFNDGKGNFLGGAFVDYRVSSTNKIRSVK